VCLIIFFCPEYIRQNHTTQTISKAKIKANLIKRAILKDRDTVDTSMDSIRTRGASGATARLRRTFRYPSDDELSDGLPEAMDEQGWFIFSHSLSITLDFILFKALGQSKTVSFIQRELASDCESTPTSPALAQTPQSTCIS